MNFYFLWAITLTSSVWSTEKFFQILLVGFALGKAPILTQFFGKTNRICPSPTLPRYVSQFSKLRFLNQQWHTRQLKGGLFTRTICFSKFYQAHTGHLSKRSDSWRLKGARHVWGRSVKCLGLIAGVSFRRFTPSPNCLFFALSRSLPPVRERLEKERKRLLRRLK